MAAASVLVASVTAAVAVAVGVAVVPRPRVLHGEGLFKAALSGVGAGRGAPWVPSGGHLDARILRPADAANGVDPALAEQLDALPDPASRWRALQALPPATWASLSAEHDPARWIGPVGAAGALTTTDALRAASAASASRLRARWVHVAGEAVGPWPAPALGAVVPVPGRRDPAVGAALAGLLRAAATAPSPWEVAAALGVWAAAWAGEQATKDVVDGLTACVGSDPSDRLLVAVTGDAAPLVVRALLVDMALRDRVAGVLAVGAAVGGVPGRWGPLGEAAQEDLLGAGFRHELLDNETLRRIPWAAVTWIAARAHGLDGLPPRLQRWPAPGFIGGGRFMQPREAAVIEVVNLGALDADAPPPEDALTGAATLAVGLLALALAG